MSIRIANLKTYVPIKNETAFYIGRPGWKVPKDVIPLYPLANQWRITNKQDRKRVLNMYRVWFNDALTHDKNVENALNVIKEAHKCTNIALLCWCAPEPCHADIIREELCLMENLNTTVIQAMEAENADEIKLETAIIMGGTENEIENRLDSQLHYEELSDKLSTDIDSEEELEE